MSTTAPTAISSHLAVRPEWLAKSREAALEPELPIVDPHHHLIDRPESGTYLLPDLLKDISKAAITSSPPSTSNGCRCTAATDPPRCGPSARSSSPMAWRP